jgi:hypothetical protein
MSSTLRPNFVATLAGIAGGMALACAVALPARAAGETEYRLTPVADTTLFADISGVDRSWDDVSDALGNSLWTSTTAGGIVRRTLLRFDLGAIPSGQRVVFATLSLYESRARDGHEVQLHRVLAPWGEGSSNAGGSGTGAPATAGDATWRWRDFGVAEWATRGGDFVAEPSASTLVGAPLAFYTWGSTSGMLDDVQGWLDEPASNHGWILIGAEIDVQNAKRFDSRHSLTASQWPTLVVRVTPIPEPASALLMAAGLAGLALRRLRRGRGA